MSWQEEGLAFILKNPVKIEERILWEEFGGMKFSSFIRQVATIKLLVISLTQLRALAELLWIQKNLRQS